ncbi:MAG: U32 family peptidase [Oscillospiraceae bacterium]|nr:U32 family peptidase [Oscillospiraceae bacterium]
MSGTEILAPAGSLESLKAAVNCGADAVYIGGKQFSARQNAANFDNAELKQAADLCHLHNIKIYLTVNTIIFDNQVNEFAEFIKNAANAGIDAFIVQDFGAAEIIRNIVPDANIHGSTQMTIHSVKGAQLLKELGFKRVVISRELTEKQIQEICSTGIETEVFVHGALCMCMSGQCYLSSLIGQRSANRGFCAQPCRLPYSVYKNPQFNGLSLKDLSLVNHLQKLSDIGVFSLKIEGRMKRPEYVAAAVCACRQSLNGQTPDMALLRSIFSRSGFTDGYFTGKFSNMFGSREKEDVIAAKDILPDIRKKYSHEKKSGKLDFYAEIKKDNPVKLTVSDDCDSVTVTGEIPETAIKKPIDFTYLERQLSKLGGTIYQFGNLNADIDDGLSLSAKTINALRRNAVEALNLKSIKRNTPEYICVPLDIDPENKIESLKEIRVRISNQNQLDAVSEADRIIIPTNVFLNNRYENISKIIIEPPRFIYNEAEIFGVLKKCKSLGAEHLMCSNPAYIKIGKELGFKLHGDFGLNTANSYSLNFLKKMNFEDTVLSFEMKLKQISSLRKAISTGIIAYGYLPVMLTKNCPIKNEVGCEKCKKIIFDRTGRANKIVCHGNYTEILNAQALYLADRLEDLKNISFITLYFTDEGPDEIKKIIDEYRFGYSSKDNITRGLYYRGVI